MRSRLCRKDYRLPKTFHYGWVAVHARWQTDISRYLWTTLRVVGKVHFDFLAGVLMCLYVLARAGRV